MKYAVLLAFLGVSAALSWGKDKTLEVQVVATHSVTHEDQGSRAVIDKGLGGPFTTTRQVESFNLDTLINGENVTLTCDDRKGCEAPAAGKYDGELKRSKWIKLSFTLPVTHKRVSRWYKIAGSWSKSSTQ